MSNGFKIACVFARNLPVQVERQKRGADLPLLIAHPVEGAAVFAASDDAAEAGVAPGMSLYQARRIVPTALVIEPDEMTYHARHGAIQAALQAFSPAVETAGLGELLVDARGLERGHEGEQALAQAMCAAARSAGGLAMRVGLASGKFTAQQAARRAPSDGVCVVPAGTEPAFLAPLPVSVLPHLPGEMRRRLSLFDLHTLGDLAGLKKAAVLRQFGAEHELASLYELARGRDPRPLNPDAPPLRLVRSLHLAGPVAERQTLLNAVNRLGRQLGQALAAKGYQAEALKLTLYAEDGSAPEIGRAVKPPTSDDARLRRLAAQLLGRLQPGAPVVSAALSAYPLRPWHLGAHQMALMAAGVSAKQTRLETALQSLYRRFGQTVIRVAALLGPPVPLKIRVSLNADGLPARLEFGGAARLVIGIDEQWREEKAWWDKPLRRDYFRVWLADGAGDAAGSPRNIFQDLLDGEWYLDRAWPLL